PLRAAPLTASMLLMIAFVASFIAVYSIGYMHGDEGYARFFAEIALFLFMMTTLVLADNFVLLYLGWEGVGLCSYLLIGFWFERKIAADAAKKAFITTRIGDSAFLIGIIFIWLKFHSLDFQTVFHAAPSLANGTATVMALLVAHAFFKALLFLAAGSVMHALPGDEVDMTRMGGLRRVMPVTAYAWVVGWLAMAGIPPLSGFFAKDQVVASASQSGRIGLWY